MKSGSTPLICREFSQTLLMFEEFFSNILATCSSGLRHCSTILPLKTRTMILLPYGEQMALNILSIHCPSEVAAPVYAVLVRHIAVTSEGHHEPHADGQVSPC
ncbi:hypothetical protein KC19_7G171800 [Ceratodon purpureus]|uniref:Uncharacterized protein n=1 Tax=Ceratodon purpureus TaxID=3225 RepID=A0A8T0HBY6_CERPU|nr:hypothetical protein KC19_N047100 [Ceratodon purpureus]KAG0504395.1 hypothetical protein KC19_N036600 [Ceratodon purpureus]KAG0504396.1 hypothetical protein KC19_N036800 [Ceratodon purpureus]KAG0504411.1 hypothetical protein KC19_N035000 [Ceratodon purpureus]KAG0504413.1 hypothetical protein KC19_N035200 [Ceratodon purpureus]